MNLSPFEINSERFNSGDFGFNGAPGLKGSRGDKVRKLLTDAILENVTSFK